MDEINPTPAVAAVASPASPGPPCSTNARQAGEPDGIARSTPRLDPQPATPSEQPSAPFTPAPKEPPGAFAAFLVYFQLPGKRRLTTVARKTGAGLRTVYRWASEFNWAGRVNQHQASLFQQRARIEAERQEAERIAWSERAAAIREREWEITDDLLQALQRRLQAGELDETTLASLARTLTLTSKIARLASGLTAHPADDGDAVDPREQEFDAALQTAYAQRTHGPVGSAADSHEPPTRATSAAH